MPWKQPHHFSTGVFSRHTGHSAMRPSTKDMLGYGTNGYVVRHRTKRNVAVKYVFPHVVVVKWPSDRETFASFVKLVTTERLRVDHTKYPTLKIRSFGDAFDAKSVREAARRLGVDLSMRCSRQEVRELPCDQYSLAGTVRPKVVANGKVEMDLCGPTVDAMMPLEKLDVVRLIAAMATATLSALDAGVAIVDLKPLNTALAISDAPRAFVVLDVDDCVSSDDAEGGSDATYQAKDALDAKGAMAVSFVITAVMAASSKNTAAKLHRQFHHMAHTLPGHRGTNTTAHLRAIVMMSTSYPAVLLKVLDEGRAGVVAAQAWANAQLASYT